MKHSRKLLALLLAAALIAVCVPAFAASAEVAPAVSLRFVSNGDPVTSAPAKSTVTAQVVLTGNVQTVTGASLYLQASGIDLSEAMLSDVSGYDAAECNYADDVLAIALFDETGYALTDGVLCSFDVTLGTADATLSMIGVSGDVTAAVTDTQAQSLPIDTFDIAGTISVTAVHDWFAGAQLVLNESIGINYYVPAAKLDGNSKAFVRLVYDVDRDGTAETVTIKSVPATVGDLECARFYFGGIAPDNMGTDITAELLLEEDGDPVDSFTYSVTTYLRRMAGSEDGAFDTLFADLLAYGKATEVYTGQQSILLDDTLSGLLAQASTGVVADTEASNHKSLMYPKALSDANAGVLFTSVGLNLKDNAAILYSFKPADGKSIADYTLKLDCGGDITSVALSEDMEQKDGSYVYRFRKLGPDEMSKVVKAYFVDGSGNVASAYLRYSIDSYAFYCYNNRNAGETAAKLYTLTQALIRYGNSVTALLS